VAADQLDRERANVETLTWSPRARAFKDAPLKYLDNLELEHALALRKENRLDSLRSFLFKAWREATREDSSFAETNARLFAEELKDEVARAEAEWDQIDRDLLKMVTPTVAAALAGAGPAIPAGHGLLYAAATVASLAGELATSTWRRSKFPQRFPAAFFMKIDRPHD
jgi:hypothetical protein